MSADTDVIGKMKEIFLTARRIDDAAERTAYLEEACQGDDNLHEQVAQLLAADSDDGRDVLQTVIDSLSRGDVWLGKDLLWATMPISVGPYRIVKMIGKGGMGVVYLAEQEYPVRRQVALKVIKPGMDFDEVVVRFEAERQALAIMEHPNIARVLDVGTTDQGLPYLAMEYVEGVEITTYCQKYQLTIKEVLSLFCNVCDAVQHAHQKGIIHRDLKPSNILVRTGASGPEAKVIDFGIAKGFGDSLKKDGQLTVAQGLIGTPMYMSPEQADPKIADVDTRSDVYSLGVILYELLTGYPPFDQETFRTGHMDDLRKIICDVEPLRPSQRGVGDTKVQESGRQSWNRQLRGELDWIVMKALEKDRERRFQSPNKLAEDIQNYLTEQPVLAGPPSKFYRLRKLAWRHRLAIGTSLAVFLALVGGLSIAIGQAVRASHAERRAETHLLAARESRLETQRLLYASNLQLAGENWRRNDIPRMRELLQRQIPRGGGPVVDFRGFEWHWMWKQSAMESRLLLDVGAPLYCACICPNVKIMAVSGADGQIRLLRISDWSVERVIDSGQIEVNSLHYSPKNSQLVSAGDDGTVVIWNPHTGEKLRRINAHNGLAYGAKFSPDGKQIISCGQETAAKVWDVETGELITSLDYHDDVIEAIDVSPAGMVALASKDHRSSLWRLPEAKFQWDDNFWNIGTTTSVDFSDNGQYLAQGQFGGLLSLLIVGPPKQVIAREVLSNDIFDVAISPEAKLVAAGDRSGFVHLFPIEPTVTSRGWANSGLSFRSRQWQAHEGRVYAVIFLPDGRHVVSAGQDGRLIQWNLDSGRALVKRPMELKDFVAIENCQVLVVGLQGVDRVSLDSTNLTENVTRMAYSEVCIAGKSQPKQLFARTGDEKEIHSWSGDHAAKVVVRVGEKEGIAGLGVSPDGRFLAVDVWHRIQERHKLRLYDVELQKVLWETPCHDARAIAFSNEGTSLAYTYNDNVIVRDTLTGDERGVLKGHRGGIQAISFLPDGVHVATGSGDRTLRIWKFAEGEVVWSVIAHQNSVEGVACHPDGAMIATAGQDGMIRFWRWKIHRLLCEIPAEEWPIKKVEFTPDGNRLICNYDNQGILIYDGTPVQETSQDFVRD